MYALAAVSVIGGLHAPGTDAAFSLQGPTLARACPKRCTCITG